MLDVFDVSDVLRHELMTVAICCIICGSMIACKCSSKSSYGQDLSCLAVDDDSSVFFKTQTLRGVKQAYQPVEGKRL